jgi:RNA recognition motif-containing protein
LSVRLFVGNLSYEVTESELRELFSEAGGVSQVRIPLDRETGRPRGFAFIDLEDRAQADEAMRRFNQQVFKGRPLAVTEAVAREEGSRGPSRGPGGGGPPPSRGGDGPPPPSDGRARTFGADSAPRAHRKPEKWATKPPKGPIKETGGGSFNSAFDTEEDDALDDERPFWEVADSADSEG